MSRNASTYHFHTTDPAVMQHEVFAPAVLRELEKRRPQRVLDLGCGCECAGGGCIVKPPLQAAGCNQSDSGAFYCSPL